MALYKTEGVVLRTRPLGEADRIITIFTSSHGKVDAVARGSRKSKSRLAGATQLFTRGHYMIFPGRSLDRLTQAHIGKSFSGLRDDLEKLAYASYVSELTDVMTMPSEPDADLYQLLLGTFTAMDTTKDPVIPTRRFELCLMSLLGYAPHLTSCVRCGGHTGRTPRLSVKGGGLICSDCFTADGPHIAVNPATIEWMKRLPATPVQRLGVLRLSQGDAARLEKVCRAFVDYRLPRRLKSIDFITSLGDMA